MKIFKVLHASHKALRTFSGIQPTGTLHLGNYFGAVQQWVKEVNSLEELASEQRLFCVVDLHAITMPQNPQELRKNIQLMSASLIGCGLDPDKCVVFEQSKVKQHAELSWILGCFSTVPSLQRLSQYKDKSKGMSEVPLGLFIYPVLQAADILLYKANNVPVGEDNLQNVEFARRLARSFNHRFNQEVFPIPNAVLVKEEASRRIKSLRQPNKKMSKSDSDKKSCLYILDEPDVIREKIKKAVTDSIGKVTFDPEGRPGVSNLVCIHSQMSNKDPLTIVQEVEQMDTGQYKLHLVEAVVEHFKPIREDTLRLLNNPDHLEAVLKRGSDRAESIAVDTMDQVKKVIGFHL